MGRGRRRWGGEKEMGREKTEGEIKGVGGEGEEGDKVRKE